MYVTDGFTAGDYNVYSDNGHTEGYDLGDAVTFQVCQIHLLLIQLRQFKSILKLSL